MQVLMYILFGTVSLLIAALAVIVVVWIIKGTIDLTFLIADEAGDASMSRFQLLIFTFIVAIGLVRVLATSSGGLPEIPSSILVLIGVSGSTYAVGKAVNSSPEEEANAAPPAGNTPPKKG